MSELEKRRIPLLPELDSPVEILALQSRLLGKLEQCLYGKLPAPPEAVTATLEHDEIEEAYAGKATDRTVKLSFPTPKGEFSFPVEVITPVGKGPFPFFVNICFHKNVPSRYLPVEEIIDRGYGLATFWYEDVSSDSAAWDGIALAYDIEPTAGDAWGKIGMWAFAASRVMDYLSTLSEVDQGRVAVIGHSRLGKTALWAGANDHRFSVVISNESGCGGAAINRGKVGETLSGMTGVFPYWFCPNMLKLKDVPPEKLTFDAHELLCLIAPRTLLVGSAVEDLWADPASEFLSCKAASSLWTSFGETGLAAEEDVPAPNVLYFKGKIGYELRSGAHFMSRTDWNRYMDYRDLHKV